MTAVTRASLRRAERPFDHPFYAGVAASSVGVSRAGGAADGQAAGAAQGAAHAAGSASIKAIDAMAAGRVAFLGHLGIKRKNQYAVVNAAGDAAILHYSDGKVRSRCVTRDPSSPVTMQRLASGGASWAAVPASAEASRLHCGVSKTHPCLHV